MVSQSITIDVAGFPMNARLAWPDAGRRPRPAVIVLQEISAVNSEAERIADRLAGLYPGRPPSPPVPWARGANQTAVMEHSR